MAQFRQRDSIVIQVSTATTPSETDYREEHKIWLYRTICCGYTFRTVDRPLDEQTFRCPQCASHDPAYD